MRTYYMHTLDGKPAQFCEVGSDCCIAYRNTGRYGRAAPLATSLRQIRLEQDRAIRAAAAGAASYPEADHLARWTDPKRYGYVRVATPEGES